MKPDHIKPGDRVIALHGVSRTMKLDVQTQAYTADPPVVRYFGEGTYLGAFVCIGAPTGRPSEKVILDDGQTVWGHESWIACPVHARKEYPEGKYSWVKVDLSETRKRADHA